MVSRLQLKPLMNTSFIFRTRSVVVLALSLFAAGCASGDKKSENRSGPKIVNVRSTPETISLNRYLQPTEPHQFLVDVQDMRADVTNVWVRFENAPIQLELQNLGGTTWRGALTSEHLRRLAVSGKTIEYRANIIARNERGQTVQTSKTPIEIKVDAPEFVG